VAGVGQRSRADEAPPDLVELGAIRAAYGVTGWVRIALFGSNGEVLLGSPRWWVLKAGVAREATPQSRRYGAALLAKWPGCESKEAAEALKGATIAVPRSEFPAARPGEYYWTDLIGCRVVNRDGVHLGQVRGLRENAGGQWLEVSGGPDGNERLIPVVEHYVEEVDTPARLIRVDWDRDW
jgi:16S rRNA processing protein RimM